MKALCVLRPDAWDLLMNQSEADYEHNILAVATRNLLGSLVLVCVLRNSTDFFKIVLSTSWGIQISFRIIGSPLMSLWESFHNLIMKALFSFPIVWARARKQIMRVSIMWIQLSVRLRIIHSWPAHEPLINHSWILCLSYAMWSLLN